LDKIVECVPNFSEGRNRKILDSISTAVTGIEGVKLLSVEAGPDTNRSVFTFAGDPEAVFEAARNAIRTAVERIDMTRHRGAHPRIGAVDVCPFIPVRGFSIEECAALAEKLAAAVAEEHAVPVYLYGGAAKTKERVRLPDIRRGEYEGLPVKLKDPSFAPDFGPASFVPKTGAMVIGARDFMLAYNVNLNTKEKKAADRIAGILRESGRTISREAGKKERIPGKLKNVQAGGWYMKEYGYAQVTANLHDYKATGLHTFFDAVCEEAENLGLRVTGSELVGLAPRDAVLDAGRHYLKKQGASTGVSDKELIHAAVRSLGLSDTVPFNPEERIVEYALDSDSGSFADLTVRGFIGATAEGSAVPGGGSSAAACVALASALCSMAANLTFTKKGFEDFKDLVETSACKAHDARRKALSLMDADSAAFTEYLEAMRLPKKTESEKEHRNAAIQEAARRCIEVPLETMKTARNVLALAVSIIEAGNSVVLSDIAVAALSAEAGLKGAWLNVLINLPMLADKEEAAGLRERGETLMESALRDAEKINRRAIDELS
jgi:glutamate formiminotransferase / formiminotetrahydrofolate cyclodeaminase